MRSPSPRARGRTVPAALMLLAATTLSGCCSGAGGGGMAIGAEAPDFELPTVAGADDVRLSDYLGRVVLVNFWASWCGPCQMEIPELETLFDRYEEDGLMIIGVNTDASVKDAEAFLAQTPVSYPVVWDDKGLVSLDYKVMSLPRNVLVDRQGRVRSRYDGYDSRSFDSLKGEIAGLLEESP